MGLTYTWQEGRVRGTNTWVVVVVKSSEGLPAGSWGRTLWTAPCTQSGFKGTN